MNHYQSPLSTFYTMLLTFSICSLWATSVITSFPCLNFHGFLLDNCQVIQAPGTWQLFTSPLSFPTILPRISYYLLFLGQSSCFSPQWFCTCYFSCSQTPSSSTSCPFTARNSPSACSSKRSGVISAPLTLDITSSARLSLKKGQ